MPICVSVSVCVLYSLFTLYFYIRIQLYILCILLCPTHMQYICLYWREICFAEMWSIRCDDAIQANLKCIWKEQEKEANENWNGYSKQAHHSIGVLHHFIIGFIYLLLSASISFHMCSFEKFHRNTKANDGNSV